MKQSKEILGMPIISILDGKEIGKVKNIVVNPEQGSIEFLVVQNDQWEFGVRAIPYKLVEGLGDYAVTIESNSAVIDLAEIPVANELLAKNRQIKGTRIITKKGRFLGQITEYYVDEDNGKITGCVVEENKGQARILPREFILTFGADITVVTEDGDSRLVGTGEFLQQANGDTGAEQNVDPVNFESKEEVKGSEPDFQVADSIEFVGKAVTADLYDEQGNLMIAEGEIITEGVMDRIKKMNRNKMVELTLKIAD